MYCVYQIGLNLKHMLEVHFTVDQYLYMYMHVCIYFLLTSCFIWQVFDCLTHNRLSKSDALLQYTGSFCTGGCKVPKHAQGPNIWDQRGSLNC